MNFVDRDDELSSLHDSYSSKGEALVVIYGRRRIGKTELMQKFGRSLGTAFVYYLCDSTPLGDQLRRLSMLVGRSINDREMVELGAAGIEAVFYRIAKARPAPKLVVALDEFQRLAKLDTAIPSTFQRIWDTYIKDSGSLMLILGGSSISMMRGEVLNYSAPLYGRSTAVFHLKPLGFRYAMLLAPRRASVTDRLYMYFIFGGIPAYYAALAESITDYDGACIKEVVGQLLKAGSIFASEPSLLLSDETRNDTIYMQILELIANGVNKPGEIASKIGIAHGNLGKYMDLLGHIGLVEKEMPLLANQLRKSKTGIYRIKDNFIDFYFRELKRHINGGAGAAEEIVGDLDLIAQKKFEDLSRELVGGGAAGDYTASGRWWGTDKSRGRGAGREEIDIVAVNEKTGEILFAECKWTNKAVGTDIYTDLKRKSGLVQWRNDRKERYALFSKSGFTDEMRKIANAEKVMLFDLDAIGWAMADR